MSGIRNVTVMLLLIFYLALSSAKFTWIVQSDIKPEDLPSNLTSEASHHLLLKLLANKSMYELLIELRSEFHTMAIGKDFYRLTADENENKEYHALSEAILALSQKLQYTETVNSVIKTAIENGANKVHKEGNITLALPVIKESIEKLMQPPAPYEEYKRLKSEALAKPWPADYKIYYYEIPKTEIDAKTIAAECLNNPYIKRLMVHSTFGNETHISTASSQDTFLLAKSILRLSNDPEFGTKVQALYDEAVAEIADKLDFDFQNISEKHSIQGFIPIRKQFLKTLANKFENDPVIKTKFAETKESISKSL
ncbi:hypothetical protein V9T40_000397 [Parthenolecanium corni]|uniref:Uncharacterized protein n=1 Tax=Parthenolecanium corni TaxID=536013 RepID=A0AAN9TDA1_9HEMI